jgi:hypothetical protein
VTEANVSVIEKPPHKATIEHLKELVVEAESGELQGVIYICSYKGNRVNSGWTAVSENRMRIMGELYQVLHHLAAMEAR